MCTWSPSDPNRHGLFSSEVFIGTLRTFSLYSYYLCTCPLALNCELFVRKDHAMFMPSPPQCEAECFD